MNNIELMDYSFKYIIKTYIQEINTCPIFSDEKKLKITKKILQTETHQNIGICTANSVKIFSESTGKMIGFSPKLTDEFNGKKRKYKRLSEVASDSNLKPRIQTCK